MTGKVILTGATGFVGQHLTPLLLAKGYAVTAIARDLTKVQAFNWASQVNWVIADLHSTLPTLAVDDTTIIIHLAWQGLPNYQARFHFEDNLPASYHFLQQMVAAGAKHILVTGTCFEYGMQAGEITTATPTAPTNAYAFAKDMLRKQLQFLQQEQPFCLQWARLFYLHGAGQNPNAILAQLDTAIDNHDESFNMSGGEQLRDYLPVATAANQLLEILQAKQPGLFNVCSGQPISIRRLVEQRIAARGSAIKMNLGFYPYSAHEPMAFWGSKEELK